MGKRYWAVVLALGLSVALPGCGSPSDAAAGAASATPAAGSEAAGEAPEEAIAVKVGPAARASLSELYSTSATLRADKRATVTARTQGVVRQLLVEEGDWVEEGQPMAVLEDREQRIEFQQATANAETQRREYERAAALHAQNLLSEEQFEVARRESVDAGHAADLAELTLSRTVIRATFSGRVLARHLDVGATVGDGTAVYDIADLSPLYADVQVPERHVVRLATGQTVRVTSGSNGESAEARARIERIAPEVDPTTGTVKVTVAVQEAPKLRPGSFVRVGIVTDTHDGALVVPRSALVAEGRRWHLFRINPDDARRVELLEVTRGFEEGDRVEILATTGAERPLQEGDRVVTSGASSLSDASVVKVLADEPSGATDAPESAAGVGDETGRVAA
jgi:membrane fusion protein (multidrug efflux system)